MALNDPANNPTKDPTTPRFRWLRWLVTALVSAAISLELIARFYIGLGNPPLLMADPKIEYLFQPNQTVYRLHNLIHYNAYSQRSADYPEKKSSENELRIEVVGDSVINGGAQTDQQNVATNIVQRELSAKLGRPVVVGNASASSWGPPNELAYLQKFGLLDADILIIVVSSHDYIDVPTYEPMVDVHPAMPSHKPFSATTELITRYIIPRARGMAGDSPAIPDKPNPKDIQICKDAMRDMIAMGQAHHARVIVVQHLERQEVLEDKLLPGHDILGDESRRDGAEVVQLGPRFIEAVHAGKNPFRDAIHPNDLGQRLLADAIEQAVLKPAPATAPSTQSGGN